MDWDKPNLETVILSIAAASVPRWVVFASEEESGPDDIWTEPVILWALVEVRLNQEEADTNRLLDKEVPKPRRKVMGMISDESGPNLAEDTEFLYVGYSAKQEIDRNEWEDRARSARKKWARMWAGDPNSPQRG